MTRPPGAPRPREVGTWQAAETNAVDWLRWLGHPDASLTGPGSDGGVDVVASDALAQVKWIGRAVGSGPLRELFGARANGRQSLYFFANAGYSAPAHRYSDEVDIATFTYSTTTGAIAPTNGLARLIYGRAVADHQPGDTTYDVAHTAVTYVIDDTGTVAVEWPFGFDDGDMTSDLRTLLEEGSP